MIFFRDSLGTNGKYQHTGIVSRVDVANRKFWTIEGNAGKDDGSPASRTRVECKE